MKVKIYLDKDEDRMPFVNGFTKSIAEKITIPQYYPEGYFGLYGPPFERLYEPIDKITDEKFYYPIVVSLWLIKDYTDHLTIPAEVLTAIRQSKCKILLVNPFEGWEWGYWEDLVNSISDRFSLSKTSFVVLSGNYSTLTSLSSIVFNFWEFGYQYNIVHDHRDKFLSSLKSLDPKPYKFLCLNRRPHFHRLALTTMLFDLKDQGILTCAKKGAIEESYLKTHLKVLKNYDKDIYDKFVTEIQPILPLTFDDGIDVEVENPALDLKYDKFFDSYIHVVTETFFEEKTDRMFFSEKAFKPMAMLQPFVFFGQKHSLKTLRSLGYKTFHPWINESYDEIDDDKLRMETAVKELKRLVNLDHADLWALIQKVAPVIDHNFLHISNRSQLIHDNLRADLLKGLEK